MTTADWAIIISLVSAVFAIASFVWNIWEKFIYPKPKLSVRLSLVISMDMDEKSTLCNPEALQLSATNHGPGPIKISQTIGRLKRQSVFKRPLGAILKTYGNWPFETETSHIGGFSIPRKLEVGDTIIQYLRPISNDYKDVVKFGYTDSFNRKHWASRSSVRAAKASLKTKKSTPEAKLSSDD